MAILWDMSLGWLFSGTPLGAEGNRGKCSL